MLKIQLAVIDLIKNHPTEWKNILSKSPYNIKIVEEMIIFYLNIHKLILILTIKLLKNIEV